MDFVREKENLNAQRLIHGTFNINEKDESNIKRPMKMLEGIGDRARTFIFALSGTGAILQRGVLRYDTIRADIGMFSSTYLRIAAS